MTPPRRLLIVAATYAVGKYYALAFGEPNARVITSVEGLLAFGDDPRWHVIYVNDDAHASRPDVERELRTLVARGVTVDALGGWTYKHATGAPAHSRTRTYTRTRMRTPAPG